MIKTIVKRNGVEENFDPKKLNGWGIWASKTLGHYVDWSEVVLHVVSTSKEVTTSEELQTGLIEYCLTKRAWSYNRMAGRLHCALLNKKLYDDVKPTIQQLHEKLVDVGLMDSKFKNSFTDEDYAAIDKMIDHPRDFTYAHYQVKQIVEKYSLMNRVTKTFYETPQYTYMRVAMRMAMNKPDRLKHIERLYYYYSTNKINVPTPYFINSGTDKNSFNSCCLYTTKDTAASLAAGDHIAYMMTVNSAGIGTNIVTRALGEPVRGGLIEHQGKLPYYRALVGAIGANLQNGRGGAATVYYSGYDPEVMSIQSLKNPMTPAARQVRGVDYAMQFNRFLAQKAAKRQEIGLFSIGEHPELYQAQFSKDQKKFAKLYDEIDKTGGFKRKVLARDVILGMINESVETGRHYEFNASEANIHTPFKEPVCMSNLCTEIYLKTSGYDSAEQLYKEEDLGLDFITFEDELGNPLKIDNFIKVVTDRGIIDARELEVGDVLVEIGKVCKVLERSTNPEIAICALSAINVPFIVSDEEYAEAAYYALFMIHTSIHEADYPFPHIAYTAKKRNSAGVGVSGLAQLMARRKLKYTTQEGRNFIHEQFETHYWHLINASLRMSKEFGLAEWMNKTLWPEGWLPIDTYNKNVDSIVTVENKRDWESKRKEIIANGGIHNTVLATIMPVESSSISAGTTNSVYPIRDFSLLKTNDTNSVSYVVPDSEKYGEYYEIAWDIPTINMIQNYGIMQKWIDQGISADEWKKVQGDAKLSTTELFGDFVARVKYGQKGKYYTNSNSSKSIDLNVSEEDESNCESCKL